MTWKDKLNVAAIHHAEWPEIQMYCSFPLRGIPRESINALVSEYPFVPKSYLELLTEYDGMAVHWFVFCGSGKSKFPSFKQMQSRWQKLLGSEDAFVFAEDASGNPLFFTKDGSVHFCLADSSRPERRLLAPSFDLLMDNAFFGPQYTQILHCRNWQPNDDESWVGYLKKAGWY